MPLVSVSLRRRVWLWCLAFALACGRCAAAGAASGDAAALTNLVRAILSEEAAEQVSLIKSLAGTGGPAVEQGLAAWRQGSLYVHESASGQKTPFVLDSASDNDGRAKGLRLVDGQPILDTNG